MALRDFDGTAAIVWSNLSDSNEPVITFPGKSLEGDVELRTTLGGDEMTRPSLAGKLQSAASTVGVSVAK